MTINYTLKILPWETVVVERKLQNSLTRKALTTHHRMVLCRCVRMSSQATSPCGFGWVTTALPLVGCAAMWCWLWSSARGAGSRTGWASRWPQPKSVLATTVRVLPHLKIYISNLTVQTLPTDLPRPSLCPWEIRHPFKAEPELSSAAMVSYRG